MIFKPSLLQSALKKRRDVGKAYCEVTNTSLLKVSSPVVTLFPRRVNFISHHGLVVSSCETPSFCLFRILLQTHGRIDKSTAGRSARRSCLITVLRPERGKTQERDRACASRPIGEVKWQKLQIRDRLPHCAIMENFRMYLSQMIRPFMWGRERRRRRGTRSRRRRRSGRGGREWHLEGVEPDGTEPLLGVGGGQDVVAGEGVEVEGGAAVRAGLLVRLGGAEAVLEAHHNLLRRLHHHHSPLPGRGVRVQHGVQLQAAHPGESGLEEHHPHFPPGLLLQGDTQGRRRVG